MPQLIAMVIVVVGAMIYMFQTFGGTGDKIEGIAQKTSIITEINNIKTGLKLAARSEQIGTTTTGTGATAVVTAANLKGLADLNYFAEQINDQVSNNNVTPDAADTAYVKTNAYNAISFGGSNETISPKDVLNQKLISVSCAKGYWQEWLAASGLEMPANIQPIVADSESFAIEMALCNEGVAIVSGPFVEKELADKRLITPFNITVKRPGAWGVIYPKTMQNNTDIKYFSEWLRREA